MRSVSLGLLLWLLSGCPSSTTEDRPVEVCSRVGQRCLFAPGKLGACVARDGECDAGACYVCQSQH